MSDRSPLPGNKPVETCYAAASVVEAMTAARGDLAEVVAFLRERAARLTEVAKSVEGMEYHKAEDLYGRAGTFEDAADYLEGMPV